MDELLYMDFWNTNKIENETEIDSNTLLLNTISVFILHIPNSLLSIPGGAGFSAPVQTGPGAHPASYTMGTRSFPGVKLPGRGVYHPPPI
jgi:hypothetical protein